MKIEEVKNYYLELKPNKEWVESIKADFFFEFAETVLAELDKKNRIIDKMAEKLVQSTEWYYSEFDNYTKEQFIDYFEKKVREENDN